MTEIKPFAGLIVADFTHVLAGPACAYYLGLLGAEVIKIESVAKGDAIRHRGGTDKASAAEGMSTSYLTQGGGKRSIALDLESEQGRETMHKLLSKADIFVENHLPDTLRRLGFDEASTQQKYPQLIHCAMTGYGRGGTQENARAYDVNVQAACGIMSMTGTEESGPTRTGAPILDYGTALAASFAISAALFERSKTGKGGLVDVSMLETGLTLMSSAVTDYLKTGNEPKRRGNLANSRSPGAGSFACQSGIISLGVNEESHFESLAYALERPDWLTDVRYAMRVQRVEYAEVFAEELEQELKRYPATEIEVKLQQAGVPAARLRTMPEALASDQVKERQFIHTDPVTGLQTPTLPFRLFGAVAHTPDRPAPKHGADTDAVETWLENPLTDGDYFAHKARDYEQNKKRVENVDNIAQTIINNIQFEQNMHLMDFGAGTGLLLERIAPRVGKITAVDISKSMIEALEGKRDQLACELDIRKVNLESECISGTDTKNLHSQALESTASTTTFDGIISSMTLHHIKDVTTLFKTFFALTNEGGFVALADLDKEGGSFHTEDTGVYHFGFDRSGIVEMAMAAGFREVKVVDASVIQKPQGEFGVFLLIAKR